MILQSHFSKKQCCWVRIYTYIYLCVYIYMYIYHLWQLQENLTNFTPSFPVLMLHFCLARKTISHSLWLKIKRAESLTCQSNCADVQNRICWFLSSSVWKCIDSLLEGKLWGHSSQFCRKPGTHPNCKKTKRLAFICLQEGKETWSFLLFLIKGGKM